MKYQPPYTITPAIVNLVAEIGEIIGRYTVLAEQNLTPRLRRENRIRTIQASLAIENNTLTLEQVTAVIEGKRVLGHPREIQEVRNAFATYEAMEDWDASVGEDLLAAHELLMRGLVDETGRYRSGGVGIFRAEQLVRMAPPADRVPKLMADLLDWLENTNEHPLVEFMLGALRDAVREAVSTDHVGDQVTDQVAALIRAIGSGELGSNDLMQALGLSHRPTFRNNYLDPAMEDEWIELPNPIPRAARLSAIG